MAKKRKAKKAKKKVAKIEEACGSGAQKEGRIQASCGESRSKAKPKAPAGEDQAAATRQSAAAHRAR